MMNAPIRPGYITVTEPSGRFEEYGAAMPICGIHLPIVLTPAEGYCCSTQCVLPLASNLTLVWEAVGAGCGMACGFGSGDCVLTCSENGSGWSNPACGFGIGADLGIGFPGPPYNPYGTGLTCPNGDDFEATYTVPAGPPCTDCVTNFTLTETEDEARAPRAPTASSRTARRAVGEPCCGGAGDVYAQRPAGGGALEVQQ